jgi:hypothetical protein
MTRKSTAIRRQRRDKQAQRWPDSGYGKAPSARQRMRPMDQDTIDNDHLQGGRRHG